MKKSYRTARGATLDRTRFSEKNRKNNFPGWENYKKHAHTHAQNTHSEKKTQRLVSDVYKSSESEKCRRIAPRPKQDSHTTYINNYISYGTYEILYTICVL